MTQELCSCISCLRGRTFPDLSLRFYSQHDNTIDHTIVLDHEVAGYETISVVIHGDPIPTTRHADHLEYSEQEVEELQQFFCRLKSSTKNKMSIETGEDLKVEVFFYLNPEDVGVPQEVFLGLADTIGEVMKQFFFSYHSNIVDTCFYKSVNSHSDVQSDGKIIVTLSTSQAKDDDFDGTVDYD